jgi:hypothetical protein
MAQLESEGRGGARNGDGETSDEERSADEKLVPSPAPGIGPIGPAGDPSYMEGTLEGKGPRRGLYITLAVMAILVILAIALVLRG